MPSALFKFFGFLFQSLGYSILCIGELFMFGIFIVSILEELSRHKLSHSCRRALSYFAVAVGFSVAVFLSIRDTYPEVFRSAFYAGSSTTAPVSISSNTHSTERIAASSEPKSSNASPQDNESTFPSDFGDTPMLQPFGDFVKHFYKKYCIWLNCVVLFLWGCQYEPYINVFTAFKGIP